MGVKDLWQVLAPVCERKSLWELQDKTVAIDLSGWVCDSQNVVEHSSQPNMHLRNLFFRTSCLLLLGARPVFVLEGDAPELKLNVMTQRNKSRGFKHSEKNTGKRSRYKGIQKKCEEMLKVMGLHCVQSLGEAEALCAQLNAKGIVDGCISQDSDCFLYGGQVVYRNFTVGASSGKGGVGFSIDEYRMEQVEQVLGLSRTKLIGLSLLCGCDYNQGGVSGVGKETAVKFLATLKDAEVFPRFYSWRTDQTYEQLEKERSCGVCNHCSHLGKKKQHDKSGCELCGSSKGCYERVDSSALIHRDPAEQKEIITELNIRRKALQDEHFPSQDVIDEFSSVKLASQAVSIKWLQPNLVGFMKLADKYLRWDECYSLEKFLPLVTRWLIMQKKNIDKCPIYPESILKTRVLKGVASYEVKWSDREGLFETLISEENSHLSVTIEPQDIFERAFPKLVHEFNKIQEAKKMSKKKGKSKSVKGVKKSQLTHQCSSCGRDLPSQSQTCLCHFMSKTDVKTSVSTLEDLLDNMSLDPALKVKEINVPSKSSSQPSKIRVNCEKLKKLLGEGGDEGFQGPSKIEDENKKGVESFLSVTPKPNKKETAKFSFEYLLEDEDWSEADFVTEDTGDLSDVVQSITGTRSEVKPDCLVDHCSIPNEDGFAYEGELSDEDVPYTPLIERVRKLQKTKMGESQATEASWKLRRLSESFNAFCAEESTSSSPIVNGERSFNSDANSDVTFSLGITTLLEN